tara:strand:+ start:4164 stop:4778 length:615 start_codon:yes stop_codon:yes gene_type:complete
MSKKWTEGYPRDNAIIDYKQFNQGYNTQKSSLNGGIDRTMTPVNQFDETEKKDKAFHYVQLFRRGDMNVFVDPTTGTTGIGDFRGLSYNTYGGGWVTVDEFSLSDLKDGMLHWEFSFHVYNNTFFLDNPKSVTIRLLFDGVEVCTAYKLSMCVNTYRMICDIPVTASPNTVTIQARSVAASTTENQLCLFTLLAMQHMFIGRWR